MQQQPSEGHYVVIGAFAVHNNAIRWTDKANKNNFNAQYAMNQACKLYYVYIPTDSRRGGLRFMMKVRVETEYKDACWVFRAGWASNRKKSLHRNCGGRNTREQPESPVVEEAPVKVDSVQEEKPEGAYCGEKEPEVENPMERFYVQVGQ